MLRKYFIAHIYSISVLFVIVLLFQSCNNRRLVNIEGREVPLYHSSLLRILNADGYTVAEIKNPWGDGVLQRYLLVPRDSALPESLPDGKILRVPLSRTLLFSGVHASLLEELGVVEAVSGVCDAKYMYSATVKKALSEGRVIDCGSSLNVNSEKVVKANPEAIFVLPYENGGYGKLENLPFTLIECADYMETSPLGCAEWVRFYGRLFGKGKESDSLFARVCEEYESLRMLAKGCVVRPKLMCELKSSSAWYVPAGESTMGQLYSDAAACYLFSYNKGSGSIPLSYEVVLDKAADADIWLIKYNSPIDKTISSLIDEFSGYTHFKPLMEREVYGCNTNRNNIFEETSFHPERLLKELVAIFHPELLIDYKLKYYEKLH